MPPPSLSSILPPPETEEKGPRLRTPETNSIQFISQQSGASYATVHTLLVVMLFILQFRSLVSEPRWTMIVGLGPLTLLQCAYCSLCLPPVGKWQNTTTSNVGGSAVGNVNKTVKPNSMGSLRKRNVGAGKGGTPTAGGWKAKIQPNLYALALALLLPPLPLTIFGHILGAPLYPTSLILDTAVLSLHISLLTCLPLFYVHGVSGPAWRDVIAAWLPFDEAGVWGGSVCCLVGGWLGAIPMALDWDRDWQTWPVTIMVGCYGGWALGKTLLGPVLVRGKRIDMSPGPEHDRNQIGQEPVQKIKKLQ